MSRHQKTLALIEMARDILAEGHPMTVRQVFYQLVSRQVIENSEGRYKAVSRHLADARVEGLIEWEWIEDRLRRPRTVSMWSGLSDFAETCRRSYRLDVWPSQPRRLEVWLEKDALSGIFEDILAPYGVTLNVGRGYDGWSSIHNAAVRYNSRAEDVIVLYFGDFDPSGEDMKRSLEDRLEILDCRPEVIKCALTRDDISRYNLPPNFTKKTDTRSAAFVAEHGDVSVELDALPADVLRARLEAEVRVRMDLDALAKVKKREDRDRAVLVKRLGKKGTS